MPPEQWTIILQSEAGGGEGAGAGGAGAGASGGETPNQRKQLFEDAGKVFGAIASTAGMLAILIRSIGGSTVASTFMEVIFKILGALWDLFLIQFLPIFMVLVRWLLSLMPVVTELGNALKPLIELIADKLEGLLNAITEWIVPRLIEFAKALTAFGTTGDISPLLAWGEKFFKDLFELASKLLTDVIAWLKEKGPAIIESIGKGVTLVVTWLKDKGPALISTLIEGIKMTQDMLTPLWNQLVTTVGPLIKQALAPLQAKLDEWIEYFKKIFKVIFDEVAAYLKGVFDVLLVYITDRVNVMFVSMLNMMHILFDPFHLDKGGDMQREMLSAYDKLSQLPGLQKLPDGLASLKRIEDGIKAITAPGWGLTNVANPVVAAINTQTGEIKKGNDEVKNAVINTGSTGRTPQSALDEMFPGWGHCDYKAPAVAASSNSAQTGNVMYLARKKIYEEMTGKQYLGN